MVTLFWIFILIVLYTYVGYAILLRALLVFVPRRKKLPIPRHNDLPEVTLFITAFNEMDIVDRKIENTHKLNYPKDKLKIVWVTDGSDDGSPEYLQQQNDITVFHSQERRGKINAMNRGMQYVSTPIVVFTDANTDLNSEALQEMARVFQDKNVGCIAGEKRIQKLNKDNAAGSGEGFYWRFESKIKQMDDQLGNTIGAAGELFAVRRELFEEVEPDTLLDDFIISMRIARKGYRVAYSPNAYATEQASANVSEELKRKIRISAGGVQTMTRLPWLLNFLKYPKLSFQYISHKVLRWTVAPWALFLLFPLNQLIVMNSTGTIDFYTITLVLQWIFYLCVIVGKVTGETKTKLKIFFVPYYFVAINASTIAGQFRYFRGNQSVNWAKSKRAE